MMKSLKKRVMSVALVAALVLTLVPVAGFIEAEAAGAIPAKVNNLKVIERDENELEFKWDKVYGADGYELRRYNASTEKWVLAENSRDNVADVENLKSATVYRFKVRAYEYDKNGNKVYGSYSYVLRTGTKPNEVDNLRVTSKTTSSVTLKWDKVTRADNYRIYRYDSSKSEWIHVSTVSGTSKTISNLKSNTSYKFRIRAWYESNERSYLGDSEYITVKTKNAGDTVVSENGISAEKAKEIALERAGVKASSVKYIKVTKDKDDGVYIYEVEFETASYEYDVDIRVSDGKILDYEKDYRD